jgi:hypothetical protein
VSGGNAGQSFITAMATSIAGDAFGAIGGAAGEYTNSILGHSLFGAVVGGTVSNMQGGNFWEGAAIGLTVGLLNHASKPLNKAIDGWLQGKPEINFDKLIAAYPGDENSQISSTAAFTKVGGAVEKFYNEYIIEHPGEVPNACALRESIAFNDSNQNLKYSSGNTYKGADGKNYYLSSEKMASNLPKQFRLNSTTTRNSSLSSFNGSKGIYFMQPKSPAAFGATGHISIWNGNSVLGGHSYADHSQFYQATLFR